MERLVLEGRRNVSHAMKEKGEVEGEKQRLKEGLGFIAVV